MALALTLFQSFPKGRLFFLFCLQCISFGPTGLFYSKLSREQLHVLTVFSMSSLSSPPNLLLQHGWLYCKLKNKRAVSGCTLLSSSLHVSPIQLPFPQSLELFPPTPSVAFLFFYLLFFFCSSSQTPTPTPHIL